MPTPIDRRHFLQHTASLGAALPLAGLAGKAHAQKAELVARKVFFDNPDYLNVRISPDGQNLAWLGAVDGVLNLWVAPVADIGAARQVTRVTGRSIGTYYRWAHTNRHLVFFRDRDGDENYRAFSVEMQTGAVVPLTPDNGVKSFVQEMDAKFPEEALFQHNQRNKRYFDMFRVNLVTGASELLYENNEYNGFVTDSDFKLRLASRLAADGTAEVFERRDDASWAPFTSVPIGDIDMTRFIDFSADGKTAYLTDSRGRDKAAAFSVDMASRNATLLAPDADADVPQTVLDGQR